ncbi:MAG: heavy-metal-associated domain-containing protein [Bacteroidales bacterium]|nr:heavy-metal-associated domain-containing protein [Bacteroidota bacterium]MBL6949590.1 heavy-metal-associated domain-containing protein [Bacteroidales bacterium]
MKTKSMLLIAGLLFIGMTSLVAKDGKTEKITVHGKCGMCKSRIEKAAKSVEGVAKASWDAAEKVLTVKYDAGTTTVLEIEQAVAKVGHDTENVRADDKVYDKLHGCCKYERPVSKKKVVIKGHEGHKH